MSSIRAELSRMLLDLLDSGEISSPALRCRLEAAGVPLSPLAFDGFLAGLEATGLVRGRYAVAGDDVAAVRVYRAASMTSNFGSAEIAELRPAA